MKLLSRLTAPLIFVLLTLFGASPLSAWQNGTVYPENSSISYDLDLNAVASLFGSSRDLADFEWRLNDPRLQISNLDLNGDYRVDYLRVIETRRHGIHLIVIQAVVGPNMYQDVATIEVSGNRYSDTYVQIVGDPYLYGYNYIIEPYYAYRPMIFRYFWSPGYYRPYHSHYHWGYYPRHYRPWRPMAAHYYRRHIYRHIDRRNRYHTVAVRRNSYARKLHREVRRNDYARRYPNRSFTKRQHERAGGRIENRGRGEQRHRNHHGTRAMQNPHNNHYPSAGKNYQQSMVQHNRASTSSRQRGHRHYGTTNRASSTTRHHSSSRENSGRYGRADRHQNRQAIQSRSLSRSRTVSHERVSREQTRQRN